MSPVELAEFRKQLDEYHSNCCIRPSNYPYGAPIIFSRKKDRNLRICIDSRAFNQQTRPDKYPLPRINDLLD